MIPTVSIKASNWVLSDFPAVVLAGLLKDENAQSAESYFAALVGRIVDGDTVRLIPVQSDNQVPMYMSIQMRRRLPTVAEAVSKPTETIINCPLIPPVQLETWDKWQQNSPTMPLNHNSTLARLYGIDAPEVVSGGMIMLYNSAPRNPRQNSEYGSQHLDIDGQALGVAAGRALSELLLGRVVLVQKLDWHGCRIVVRILVPAVTDRQLDGDFGLETYFCNLLDHMKNLLPENVYIPETDITGVHGVAILVERLRHAGIPNSEVHSLIFKALAKTRINGMPGLLEASDEMLRRGLAVVCQGAHVSYAGRRTELERLERGAEVCGCGRWGLPSFCQLDPQVFRNTRPRGRSVSPHPGSHDVDRPEARERGRSMSRRRSRSRSRRSSRRDSRR